MSPENAPLIGAPAPFCDFHLDVKKAPSGDGLTPSDTALTSLSPSVAPCPCHFKWGVPSVRAPRGLTSFRGSPPALRFHAGRTYCSAPLRGVGPDHRRIAIPSDFSRAALKSITRRAAS